MKSALTDAAWERIQKILHVVYGAAGFISWCLLRPGMFTNDANHMLAQAANGPIHTHQPPISALFLRFMLYIGTTPAFINMMFSILLTLGARMLCLALLESAGVKKARQELACLVLLVFLFSPLTAFKFIAVTFVKDYWFTCVAIWAVYCAVKNRWVWASILVSLACLMRHNALVVAPALYVAHLFVKRQWIHASLLPLALFPLFHLAVTHGTPDLRIDHPYRQVRILEVVGACVLRPELEPEAKEVFKYFQPDWRQRYIFGEQGNICNFSSYNPLYGLVMLDNVNYTEEERVPVDDVYATFVRKYPFTILHVKWKAFLSGLIRSEDKDSYFITYPVKSYGVNYDFSYPVTFKSIADAAMMVRGMPVLQWITFHRFWLVVLFVMIPLAWKTSRTMLYPLAFALAYHLSYLVAVTAASDYRMLYPSTILIQITTLAWLLGGGWGMMRKKEASGQGVSCPTR